LSRLGDKMRERRGIALILVLMVITVLTVLILDLHQSVRINFYIANNMTEGLKASYLARSGVQVAAGVLLKDMQDNKIDSWHEDWYDFLGKAGMPAIPVGENEMVMMEINDESGRFNLNTLVNKRGTVNQRRVDIFKNLLAGEDIEVEVANAIVDWIDEDSEVQDGGGAEDQVYGYSAGSDPMLSKNSRFESLQEIRLVQGVTDEIWRKLEPIVSVYGNAKTNLNTADKKVLAAVLKTVDENADTAIADKIDEWRKQSASEEDDDEGGGISFSGGEGNVFKKKGMVKQLVEIGMDRGTARRFGRYFGVSSRYFRVTTTALVKGVQKNAVGIIFRKKKKVSIVYYRVAPGVATEHQDEMAAGVGANGQGVGAGDGQDLGSGPMGGGEIGFQ
jgi:general secretion pathway protein K